MLPYSFVGAPLAMTKRRWRETLQVLYENHFDPSKDEELKLSKIDIESNFPKILKLVKDPLQHWRNQNTEANLSEESELIELIEDFHKQYQFVYDLYDLLKGQLSQTVNDAKEDEGYFTATSSSDSETENDVSSKDTKDNSTHSAQESEKMQQEQEEECNKLREKMGVMERELSTLARMHRLRQKESFNLMRALESELSSLNFLLESMCVEKIVLGEPVVDIKSQNDQVSNIEKIEKEMEEELAAFINDIDGVQNGSISEASIIKALMAQVSNIKLNVNCLNVEKDDCEKQMQQHGNDVSTLHEKLSDQVNKMKLDLGSLRSKNTELESKLTKKSRENSDFLSQIETLEKGLVSKTSDLEKMQKEKEDTQMRVKRLESELHNFSSQKSEIEEQIAKKDHENSLLQREMEGLQGKMAKMENMLKEREDQFFALQKKLEDGNEDGSAQIVALTTQINHLEQEIESKNELERQISIHKEDMNKLKEEKECLQRSISELEKKLEVRRDEFSNLQNEMSNQIMALRGEVSHLQQEMDLKRKLDEQISCQDKEIGELREEKESLQAKMLELEITLTEREDQMIALERRVQIGVMEKSELSNQISYLQREMSSEKQQCNDTLAQMEKHNKELINRVADQQVILKQQEDTLNNLREDCKQVKGRLLRAADRKMDEVLDEFRKNFEDKLRILSRRIRVSEQLHSENKEHCKRLKEHCEEQHPALERRLSELMSTSKAALWRLSETVEVMMKGMEKVLTDFEIKEGSFEQRMSRVSEEIQVAKNWVRWTMDEMKPKYNDPAGSPFSPSSMDEKEQDKATKEKIKRLEAKVNKEKGDKLRLMRGAYELQKKVAELEKVVVEKDEGLLRLQKEKIEAIRQLCMWIDYRQSRFDQLKDMILVKRTKNHGKR